MIHNIPDDVFEYHIFPLLDIIDKSVIKRVNRYFRDNKMLLVKDVSELEEQRKKRCYKLNYEFNPLWTLVNEKPNDNEWNNIYLAKNKCTTWDIYNKYYNLHFNATDVITSNRLRHSISENPNISFGIIQNNPKFMSSWQYVMLNPNIADIIKYSGINIYFWQNLNINHIHSNKNIIYLWYEDNLNTYSYMEHHKKIMPCWTYDMTILFFSKFLPINYCILGLQLMPINQQFIDRYIDNLIYDEIWYTNISMNKSITYKIYKNNPRVKWNINHLAKNMIATVDELESLGDRTKNIIYKNPNIPFEYLIKYINNLDINEYNLNKFEYNNIICDHKGITLDFIKSENSFIWYSTLLLNPSLTYEMIKAIPKIMNNWNKNYLSKCEFNV